ncbi:MAG: hydroxyethylthiazole kinase-like uncharacterized protein yjeF [Myxococcota bacterium]
MSGPFGPRDAHGLTLLMTTSEVREVDRLTIAGKPGVWPGIPGRVLMELAGAGTARLILDRVGGRLGKAVVLCGAGNNGGDGYVVARHLHDAGWTVRCIATHAADTLQGDAAANHAIWLGLGGELRYAVKGATAAMRNWIGHATVVVDALFGTGLSRPIDAESPAAALIGMANAASHGLKVAADIPSGIDGSTGQRLGVVAFRADLTATYGVAKTGLLASPGADDAGELIVVPLAFPSAVIQSVGASARLITGDVVAGWLPRREPTGHKGTFGHVGVVGGFAGKEGAACLTARGALRGGAGLTTWVVPATEEAQTDLRDAEVMLDRLADGLAARPTVWVIGPGLGQDTAASELLNKVLADHRPVVVDADALNLLATQSAPKLTEQSRVLTPHPLEAARLLGQTAAAINADRYAAMDALVAKFNAVVVLKGARTLVGAPSTPTVVVDIVEPTLAVGGSGDVLSGIIAALLAQGADAWKAAVCGVYLHGLAGRHAGQASAQRGVLASEIADAVPTSVQSLLAGWT